MENVQLTNDYTTRSSTWSSQPSSSLRLDEGWKHRGADKLTANSAAIIEPNLHGGCLSVKVRADAKEADSEGLLLPLDNVEVLHVFEVYSVSKYMDSRMQRLCHVNGSEATFMCSIKAFKQDRPYTFIVFSLVVPLIVCSYDRMFERPLISVSG